MSEARIGRVFVASLHQAIADILPSRLEFYENWINSSGLREGTIGLGPLTAVLSFLRREGAAYTLVTARAGEYSAIWTVSGMSPFERLRLRLLPRPLRARALLRLSRELIRTSYPGSRAIVKMRRGVGHIDIRGSLFCEVREATTHPLCGFYPAAIVKLHDLFSLEARAQIDGCRAVDGQGCLVSVALSQNGRGAADRPDPTLSHP